MPETLVIKEEQREVEEAAKEQQRAEARPKGSVEDRLNYLFAFVHYIHSADMKRFDEYCEQQIQQRATTKERLRQEAERKKEKARKQHDHNLRRKR